MPGTPSPPLKIHPLAGGHPMSRIAEVGAFLFPMAELSHRFSSLSPLRTPPADAASTPAPFNTFRGGRSQKCRGRRGSHTLLRTAAARRLDHPAPASSARTRITLLEFVKYCALSLLTLPSVGNDAARPRAGCRRGFADHRAEAGAARALQPLEPRTVRIPPASLSTPLPPPSRALHFDTRGSNGDEFC